MPQKDSEFSLLLLGQCCSVLWVKIYIFYALNYTERFKERDRVNKQRVLKAPNSFSNVILSILIFVLVLVITETT